MLNFAKNLQFKFTDCLFHYIIIPSSFVYRHLSFFDSLAFIEFLLSLVVFLHLGPQFTLCMFLFLLIPSCNTTGYTYYVCATFCIDSRIKFCLLRLLLLKVTLNPSAPTECQTVNRFGHITNRVSVEKATSTIDLARA